jgi:hypothetical protein
MQSIHFCRGLIRYNRKIKNWFPVDIHSLAGLGLRHTKAEKAQV